MRKVIALVLGLFICAALAFVVWRNTQSPDASAAQASVGQPTAPASVAANSEAPATEDSDGVAPAEHHLIAYYFMNDVRCPSCVKIETWTHSAIEEAYAEELASGKLVWRMVNTDQKENHHFVADYELVTKQVILVEMNKGQQVDWVNLAEVWNLLGDEEKFKTYIVSETAAQLNWDRQTEL